MTASRLMARAASEILELRALPPTPAAFAAGPGNQPSPSASAPAALPARLDTVVNQDQASLQDSSVTQPGLQHAATVASGSCDVDLPAPGLLPSPDSSVPSAPAACVGPSTEHRHTDRSSAEAAGSVTPDADTAPLSTAGSASQQQRTGSSEQDGKRPEESMAGADSQTATASPERDVAPALPSGELSLCGAAIREGLRCAP